MTTKSGASLNRGGSRQDYETPPDFMVAVEAKFGPVVNDLAASSANHKGQRFITIEDNSLACDWTTWQGLSWLNPPFSNIAPWAEKCAKESARGCRILFLVPASIGSNWFDQHVHGKAMVYALNGRLTFVGAKDPYPKDCILAYYGGIPSSGFDVWRWK